MSKTIQQELDEYLLTLAEIRKLYTEDGTITPDEKSQLDSRENRIQLLRSAIDSGHGRKQNGKSTAVPTVGVTPEPSVDTALGGSNGVESAIDALGAKSMLASAGVMKASLGIHLIAEIPPILLKLLESQDKAEAKKANEEIRKIFDTARQRTLENYVADEIAKLADSQSADQVGYTRDQAVQIRELLEKLQELGHNNDNFRFGKKEITLGGGYFAKVVESQYWTEQEREFRRLAHELEIEVASGDPRRIQGPGVPAQGPIDVDRSAVRRLFFDQASSADYIVDVRGDPVSTADDQH